MSKKDKCKLIVELLFEIVEEHGVEVRFSDHFGMVVDYLGTHSHVDNWSGEDQRLESLLNILRAIKNGAHPGRGDCPNEPR